MYYYLYYIYILCTILVVKSLLVSQIKDLGNLFLNDL